MTLSLSLTSCSDDDVNDNFDNGKMVYVEMSTTDRIVAKKSNDFGFRLLDEINHSNRYDKKNLVLSPISINYAFSMLANGASGETRKQITRTLGYTDIDMQDINSYNTKLVEQLENLDPKVRLDFANSIWFKPDVTVKQQYITTLMASYDADVKDINTATFVNDVNAWCSKKTNGKIPDFFNEGSKVPGCALYNAVYFKGLWNINSKFDANDTKEGYFNNADGTQTKTKFMNNVGGARYFETSSLEACELYFGRLSFKAMFILPKEGASIESAVEALADGEWDKLKEQVKNVEVTLSLPKFKIESEIGLDDLLCNLGLSDVFSGSADYSNISDENLSISDVKQKAIFEINEEGAEAAAVTGVGIDTSNVVNGKVSLSFDRPFIYVVYEHSTGTILFLGEVNSFAN